MPGALLLLACEGLFEGVYDNDSLTESKDEFYVDASDWKKWYYIDLEKLSAGETDSFLVTKAIPTDTLDTDSCQNGIYTYWYDVYGKGIDNHRYQSYYPTAPQPEPDNWSIAIHRNNMRTNGGGVLETELTDFSQLPTSSDVYKDSTFTEDEWNQTDVWVNSSQMTSGLIGNQGIKVNRVLSSWLKVYIPPIPPAFTHNNHIFILRLKDGTFAALQLVDYISPTTGTKCCLRIKYKYPIFK